MSNLALQNHLSPSKPLIKLNNLNQWTLKWQKNHRPAAKTTKTTIKRLLKTKSSRVKPYTIVLASVKTKVTRNLAGTSGICMPSTKM